MTNSTDTTLLVADKILSTISSSALTPRREVGGILVDILVISAGFIILFIIFQMRLYCASCDPSQKFTRSQYFNRGNLPPIPWAKETPFLNLRNDPYNYPDAAFGGMDEREAMDLTEMVAEAVAESY